MLSRARLRRFFRSRVWAVARVVIGIGLGALALSALNGQRGELVGASAELGHLRLGWLLGAIALELCSFVAFGQLQRQLLLAGSIDLGAPYAAAMSFAAGAIADSLPAGPAFASLYAYRLYRRAGADEVLAGWTLVATFVCAGLTLAVLATVGVGLALRESSSFGLVGIIFVVLVISIVADAVVLQRRWLAASIEWLVDQVRRHVGWPRRSGAELLARTVGRLGTVRMDLAGLGRTLGASLLSWTFDCAALGCSFLAVGVGVPWRALLLTYGAAQLAVNLPITPGGLGVVEGTLTIALVAFGGSEQSTLAAVLCYRIVSFWGFLPVGWLVWLGLTWWHRREDRRRVHAAAAALHEVPT